MFPETVRDSRRRRFRAPVSPMDYPTFWNRSEIEIPSAFEIVSKLADVRFRSLLSTDPM